ncbi:WRKY DNA-binding transcription factor 70-like [Gastrolobium bilobum]|uniref:WRKY DNA-binding transcription factor 70-like n=1 Tax=Gastrolobium bilobum TaxID=150636 RepID=UPI002AB2704D|nr:WRKY DNA-binding transcription factor 70-like [Gastrolobium bilobum]
MENQLSNGRKEMEQELLRGRDIANQLLEVLVHKSNTHHEDVRGSMLPFAEDLVRKVLRSFTNTLFILNTSNDVSNEVVVPITVRDFSSSANCQKPEDTDETRESFFNPKSRRGCYKRKSTAPTWEKDSSNLIEDGYAWRKYGQKMTMNAKYLRSYFRCTHKNEQGCPAIKQVQRIQDYPPLYRTTYYGHHKCKSSINSEMILEPNSSSGSSIFLSFNNSLSSKEEYPFSSSLFASTKHEPMEVIPNDHVAHNQLSSSDYLMPCDYELDFSYSSHVTMLPDTESVQFDQNVYGCSLDFDG